MLACRQSAVRRPIGASCRTVKSMQVHRPAHTYRWTSQRSVAAQGVQFEGNFLAALEQALDRESSRYAEEIGIPGLRIQQELNLDNGSAGGIIWSAGKVLSIFMNERMRQNLPGRTVLELGAGTGIVGLAAACMGARVCMTDLPEQMDQMQDNINLNQQLINDCGGSAMITPLDWKQPLPANIVACERWDYVIGADLVYEPETIAPLAALFDELLTRYPQAVVIISHRHREQELDDHMMRGLYDRGLQLTQYQNTTEQGQIEEAISVYQVTRVQG